MKPPYGPNDESPATPALNQTYASLPLSFMGSDINKIIQSDENPALDLTDVQSDIATISSKNMPVNWGWYQEGYDHEPTDGAGPATNATYITHHEGPQYFGYLGDNTHVLKTNLHGLGDFYTAISAGKLPGSRRVLRARRLRQQRWPGAGRSDRQHTGELSPAATTIPAIPTRRSPKPFWRTA